MVGRLHTELGQMLLVGQARFGGSGWRRRSAAGGPWRRRSAGVTGRWWRSGTVARIGLALLLVAATTVVVAVAGPASRASAGAGWSAAPLPANAFGSDVTITSISCADVSDCTAVGYYTQDNQSFGTQSLPLAETYSGGTWTATALPVPTVPPVQNGTPNGIIAALLTGVSCTSATTCVAIGELSPQDSSLATGLDRYAFDEVLSGGTWTSSALFADPSKESVVTMGGIDCTSGTTCVAVGSDYHNNPQDSATTGIADGIAYSISGVNGGTPVSGLAPAQQTVVALAGVSCQDATDCTAVGYTRDQTSLVQHLLVETLSSGTWTTTSPGNPAVASEAQFEGVSCTSDTACEAVGSYTGANGTFALAESLSGGEWTPTTNLTPGDSTSDLTSVSCAAGACSAAGSYGDSDSPPVTHALVESLTASGWSSVTGIDPGGGLSAPELVGVSCTDGFDCVAIGNAATSTGGTAPFYAVAAPLPATHFSVTAPANAAVGSQVDVTVTALDENDQVVPDYAGTVQFTSTDLAAVLPANTTLTDGTVTVPVTFETIGMQTVTATDTVTSSITGTSAAVDVQGLVVTTHFQVSAPASAGQGVPVDVTITALSATNQVVPTYTGIVHFTSTDLAAVLPPDQALTNGTATVPVTFETFGDQTVTATDTVTSAVTGTSGEVSVIVPPTHFSVTGPPTAGAGQSVAITVVALEASDQVSTGYTGTVRFTSTDRAATLPGAMTFTSGDAGTITVHVTFRTAGSQTVTATDTHDASLTGTSGAILVSSGPKPAPPGPPTDLVARARGAGIGLTWVTPASNGGSAILGYRVLRGTAPGAEVVLAVSATPAFTDNSAAAGVRYYYVVEAYNAIGISARSNEVTGIRVGSLASGRLFAGTPSGNGWIVASQTGEVASFGDAPVRGSLAGVHLNQPIVTATIAPSDGGYWLAASDGGVFGFGDAGFYGSLGDIHLNQPIVAMAATPDGRGYWLVASDGGLFEFGDAGYFGSLGNIHLNQPIVGITATPNGNGYWMVASDGGVFDFGAAPFYGAAGATLIPYPIVGLVAQLGGGGYSLIDTSGGARHYAS